MQFVVLTLDALGRWVIVSATNKALAWDGSRWVEHACGLGVDGEVAAFAEHHNARFHAQSHGFIVCADA